MGKKTANVSAPANTYATDAEGYPILRGELFWRWRAALEGMQRVDSDVKLKSMQVDTLLEQHPEIKRAINERASLMQQSVTARQEYQRVISDLEAHFGFPMKDVSIDDHSGRVHVLSPEKPAPVFAAPAVKADKGKDKKASRKK